MCEVTPDDLRPHELRLRWSVYVALPEPPAGIPTEHGSGDTPSEALENLRMQLEFVAKRDQRPVTFNESLIAGLVGVHA